MTPQQIALFIKDRRKANKISQKTLAGSVGCTVLTIKMIEGNKSVPNLKLVIEILKALGHEFMLCEILQTKFQPLG